MTFFGVTRLSQAALRALPYIRGGLARGLSLNAIQRTLTGTPFAVRRADLLDVARLYRSGEDAADYLEALRRDIVPDPRRLAPATHRMLRRYSITYRAEGTNLLSGETETRYVSVSTSELLSTGELEDLAAEVVANPDAYDPYDLLELTPIGGFRRGDAGSFL